MQALPSASSGATAKGPIKLVGQGIESLVKKAKVVAHWGFVPLVLYLGFQSSDPQPTLLQLILPI
jgi:import receptor subunit TOM7